MFETLCLFKLYPAKKFCTSGYSGKFRNGCIKCYTSLFKEIILQHLGAFQTAIEGSLSKPCAFKASRGHPSKVVKLPIMSPGAENMQYLKKNMITQ